VGRARGAYDLIVAATAAARARSVAALDGEARFAELPGVDVVPLG
jgi:tRNA(fMet)-specific endonuclease VapC